MSKHYSTAGRGMKPEVDTERYGECPTLLHIPLRMVTIGKQAERVSVYGVHRIVLHLHVFATNLTILSLFPVCLCDRIYASYTVKYQRLCILCVASLNQ